MANRPYRPYRDDISNKELIGIDFVQRKHKDHKESLRKSFFRRNSFSRQISFLAGSKLLFRKILLDGLDDQWNHSSIKLLTRLQTINTIHDIHNCIGIVGRNGVFFFFCFYIFFFFMRTFFP